MTPPTWVHKAAAKTVAALTTTRLAGLELTPQMETSNADFHLLYFTGSTGMNRVEYATTSVTPSAFRRSNLGGFDVIDNELINKGNLVLVHPINKLRYNGLADVASLDISPTDPTSVVLEKTLMRGRIEEITPMIDELDTKIIIRGRSLLMDIIFCL